MEIQIIKILKAFKQLAPDQGFQQRSRQEILAVKKSALAARFYTFQIKNKFQESFNFALALAVTALIIYISLNSLAGKTPVITQNTAPGPTFNIHLQDARYYREIAPNVYIVVLESQKKGNK